MQGTTVCTAVVNLMGAKLFAPEQAYVALSRVRLFNGLRLEEPEENSQIKTLPTPTH
jgi:hypothetical protein